MAFVPKKSLGQHFLRDPNVARKIVAALQAPREAHVVEIGPGEGALTGLLRERFAAFTAVEIDSRAVAFLRDAHPGMDVRQMDVLEVDWRAFAREKGAPLFVVGNLPYNMTSPILFSLLDARDVVQEVVAMMQREVAERLVAVPRTKAYGILSVFCQALGRPERLFRVSPQVFYPRPAVTSAVVRLTFAGKEAAPEGVDMAFFRSVVRTAFNRRRKTLRNSLDRWTKGEAGIVLPEGLDARRPEELTPEEFVALARYLKDALIESTAISASRTQAQAPGS